MCKETLLEQLWWNSNLSYQIAAMTKRYDDDRLTSLRKTIKDRRTKIVKDKNGGQKGGVILTDKTIKPYVRELFALEAQMATDKEKMSTGKRADAAAQKVMAKAPLPALLGYGSNDKNNVVIMFKCFLDYIFEHSLIDFDLFCFVCGLFEAKTMRLEK